MVPLALVFVEEEVLRLTSSTNTLTLLSTFLSI